MATLTAIYVEIWNFDAITKLLEIHLRREWKTNPVTRRAADGIEEIYGKHFINSTFESPTMFAVGQAQDAWITVHYNSFFDCRQLLEMLSQELRCLVALVMIQSVSSAYHITLYRNGDHLRTLEFADGEWVKTFGKPLPFETEPLGHNIGTSEEPFYVFEEEDVTEYCEQLGLNPWAVVADEWTILSAT